MSPEKIYGSNMWWLLPGESVEGVDGRKIKGPNVVRVLELSEQNMLTIQGGEEDIKIAVEGTDFESVVQKS